MATSSIIGQRLSITTLCCAVLVFSRRACPPRLSELGVAVPDVELTACVHDALGGETGLRPTFLGHLLVELLLDAALIVDAPDRLTAFIELFRRERVLWDYLENDRMMVRLNQVLRRARLDDLPDDFAATLSIARKPAADRKLDLLGEVWG